MKFRETKHKIVFGDSRQMNEIKDKSVHLVITSPPYWQLKDYGSSKQLGFDDSYEEYINNLNLVWKECFRILENGCRLCINIGDQFARSVYYGRYKVIPIRTEIIKFCETIGFDYMGAIIWQKKTTTNTTGGASIMGSYPYPRNGILSIDYEFILLFKKLGKPNKPDNETKVKSKLTKEEWKEYFSGHWNFGGVKQDKHVAMFPEELPKRLIKMFSFIGDTVVDPFLGSGTTTLAAKNLDRNSIGYEINQDYKSLIEKKIKISQRDIFNSKIEFIEQKLAPIKFTEKMKDLPYLFKDPHKFDKKVDPRKLQYGSKINNNSNTRNEYYRVKKIISPTLIELSNDLIIRLIGIQEKKEKYEQAIEFLKQKTENQNVYLKFDERKYDENGHLLCYLYLRNRTFINAHLIKKNLANVDNNTVFSKLNKFRKLQSKMTLKD